MAFSHKHCGGQHDTVQEARDCEGNITQEIKYEFLSMNQQRYLGDLLSGFHAILSDDRDIATISYDDGKPILEALINARRLQATHKPFGMPSGVLLDPGFKVSKRKTRTPTRLKYPYVPSGYYAVPDWTKNQTYKFLRVKEGKGDWEGRIFVDEVIGGHPDAPIRGRLAVKALNAILAFGVEEAGIAYGTELHHCSECNRHLTDDMSRALGVGPECRTKPEYLAKVAEAKNRANA